MRACIAFHMHKWTEENPLLLEPGEQDTIQNFFIIPDSTQVVYIYSSIRNPAQESMAWHAVTMYDLRVSGQNDASQDIREKEGARTDPSQQVAGQNPPIVRPN